MFASNRYYFIDSLTILRSIVDGSSGQIVDVEPMAAIPGETTADRAARMLHQDQRCAALNHEDYALRRQPSGLLAARTGR